MKISVKQARILNDMTQSRMANELGIHVQTYRKIENNPDLATIEQAKMISDITMIPYDEIFFNVDSTLSRENAGSIYSQNNRGA